APVRYGDVMLAGDEVEEVFFEVCPGAADGVHLSASNHLGERNAELRRAHGPRHGDHHAAAFIDMPYPAFGGIHERLGVEVTEVVSKRGASSRHVASPRWPFTNANGGKWKSKG